MTTTTTLEILLLLVVAFSPLCFLIPLFGQAFKHKPNYDYSDAAAGIICRNDQEEADRIQYFTHIAIWTSFAAIAAAAAKFYDMAIDGFESLNTFLFVVCEKLYLMALAVLAAEFTWGLSCNSYDKTNKESTSALLWTSLFLWIFSSAALLVLDQKSGYSLLALGDDRD